MWPNDPEEDRKGFIITSTEFQRDVTPVQAFAKDVSHFVAEFTGLNWIDNKIVDFHQSDNISLADAASTLIEGAIVTVSLRAEESQERHIRHTQKLTWKLVIYIQGVRVEKKLL